MTLILTALCGCSGNHGVTPGPDDNGQPIKSPASNHWIWGIYTIAISADRTEAVLLPSRTADYFYNVTMFVEGPPCQDCLKIGKPIPLPDGTVNLKVTLRHPFYGHPKYTGFDVRGICVFKATDYIISPNPLDVLEDFGDTWGHHPAMYPVVLNFSNPYGCGAALINADGYTFYLNPELAFQWYSGPNASFEPLPIFNYYKAKHAYGDAVDTTVNPYKLFADKSPRRMFKHNDLFTRTYHIKPPEGSGPFEFGYVVSACWAPPIQTPVKNPESDFPGDANCEDAYNFSIVQLTTITEETYDGMEPTFKVTFNHRIDQFPIVVSIISNGFLKNNSTSKVVENYWCFKTANKDDLHPIDAETTEAILRPVKGLADPYHNLISGWHLGILEVLGQPTPYAQGWPPEYDTMFVEPYSVHPVMMYVQE